MSFTRTAFVLDACPVRWSAGGFRVAPCLRVEAGALAGEGSGVSPSLSAVRPWVAAGFEVHAKYVFGRRFFAEVSSGLIAPFVRDHFYFEPSPTSTVFQAPSIAGHVGGALGFTIL